MKRSLFILLISLAVISSLTLAGCVRPATTKTLPSSTSPNYESRIAALETRVAQNAEQIANLQKMVDKQATTIDYSAAINDLSAKNTALQNDVAALKTKLNAINPTEIPPQYAWVSSADKKHITIYTSGAGNYPVIVTLYGDNLRTNQVKKTSAGNYNIASEFLYSSYTTVSNQLVLIIKPITTWSASDKIELDVQGVTGTIYYVTVSTGG